MNKTIVKMRKLLINTSLIIVSFLLGVEYVASNKTAEVDTQQGVLIFIECTPVKEYEYLGTVNKSLSLTGQHSEIRDGLIKKVKKKHPDADGIIINYGIGLGDKADAIKFK